MPFSTPNLCKEELWTFYNRYVLSFHTTKTTITETVFVTYSHFVDNSITMWKFNTNHYVHVTSHFSPKCQQITPHSSPVRVSYGVYYVNSKSGLSSALVADIFFSLKFERFHDNHVSYLVLLWTSKVVRRHVEHNYRYHIDNVDKLSSNRFCAG